MYVMVVPMSYAKSLNSLRYFTYFMLPCVMYLVVVIAYFVGKDGTNTVNYAPESAGGISALPIIIFIYSGHMNVKKKK